jgi:molybdate transport system regulatory protein
MLMAYFCRQHAAGMLGFQGFRLKFGWRVSEKTIDIAIYFDKYIAMETIRQQTKLGLQWRGRIWLEGAEGTFLGHGRVVLLERIKEHGSISQAARSMEMAYKHAWDLLESMNRQAACKLVETVRGGKSGGGSTLTPAGEKAIALFWRYHERLQNVLQEMTGELEDIVGKETIAVEDEAKEEAPW